MKANCWQNDVAKPTRSKTIWETNGKTGKQAFGNYLAKPSSKAIIWETNGNDSNPLAIIWPSHPAKRSSGTHMKTHESKPLANQPAKASSAIIWCFSKGENPAQVIGKKNRKQTFGKMIWPSHPAQASAPFFKE